MATRLLLIDDHELAHAGLRMLCAARPDLALAACFPLARPALEWLARNPVDLVLLDLDLPDLAGPAVLVEILALGPHRVVIMTGAGSGDVMRTCLDLGALGVVSKSDPAECALSAVDAVRAGGRYVSPNAQRLIDALAAPAIQLTPRQLGILHLLAAGVSNKEIAYRLGIAAPTVSFHLAELRRRLGAETNRQLVDRARAARLLNAET
ncbi:MAG: response regulator [Porphyrobacter sp.]|nr:response regulator [Porphyrobacter sp.]